MSNEALKDLLVLTVLALLLFIGGTVWAISEYRRINK